MAQTLGPWIRAKLWAKLSGSALTMKLTSPWRYRVTFFERWRAIGEKPIFSNRAPSAAVSRAVYSTNSKPSVPIGLTSLMIPGWKPAVAAAMTTSSAVARAAAIRAGLTHHIGSDRRRPSRGSGSGEPLEGAGQLGLGLGGVGQPLALLLDDLGGRAGDEALIGELLLELVDLGGEARHLLVEAGALLAEVDRAGQRQGQRRLVDNQRHAARRNVAAAGIDAVEPRQPQDRLALGGQPRQGGGAGVAQA